MPSGVYKRTNPAWNKSEWPILTCEICSQEYREKPYRAKDSKFCSQACYGQSRRGIVPVSAFKKGEHRSPETEYKKGNVPFSKLNPESMPRGIDNYSWKGDSVGYMALHGWVRRQLGKPSFCEHCKIYGGNPRKYHWANKSQTYQRDVTDWLRLCVRCHKKYDQQKPVNS